MNPKYPQDSFSIETDTTKNNHNQSTHRFSMKRFSMKKLLSSFLSLSLVFVAAEKSSGAAKPLTIAMMPKSKGNAYFISCRKGAEQAAKDLGVKLLWDGPTEPDPARQNEIVETWITRGVDVIAVSVENREGLSTALRKAKDKGIKIITWDADAEPDARDF